MTVTEFRPLAGFPQRLGASALGYTGTYQEEVNRLTKEVRSRSTEVEAKFVSVERWKPRR